MPMVGILGILIMDLDLEWLIGVGDRGLTDLTDLYRLLKLVYQGQIEDFDAMTRPQMTGLIFDSTRGYIFKISDDLVYFVVFDIGISEVLKFWKKGEL